MKTLCLIFWVATTLLAAQPGPKDGFRDLGWGDHPTDNMRRTGFQHGMETYTIPDDNPGVARIDASLIQYSFLHGRLCRVEAFWSIGMMEADFLTAGLEHEWGPADKTTRSAAALMDHSLYWKSHNGRTEAWLDNIDAQASRFGQKHRWRLLLQEEKCAKEAGLPSGL